MSKSSLLRNVAILLGTFAVYAGVRVVDWRSTDRGAENIEASYHVLLTVNALDQSLASKHLYLPIVSLGRESDKHIPWGAAVPTKGGDYIYTSFYAVGFLVPFLAFKASAVTPGLPALLALNLLLHVLFVVVLAAFASRLADLLSWDCGTKWLVTSVTIAVALLSRETLQTYSIVYWSHSISQTLLVIQAWLVFEYLRADDQGPNRLWFVLAFISVLASLVEWTGFVFAVLLSGVFSLHWRWTGQRKSALAAVAQAAAVGCAGLIIVSHFSAAVGLHETLRALTVRAVARGPGLRSMLGLPIGHLKSYGLLLLVVPVAARLAWKTANEDFRRIAGIAVVISALPLLENLLMLQHATQFSFDRAKAVIPLALAAGLAMGALRGRSRICTGAALIVSLTQNVATYELVNRRYTEWPSIEAKNRLLTSEAGSLLRADCAVIGTNTSVRGYLNLLVGRGIWEQKSISEVVRLGQNPRACGSVYLDADVWEGMPRIRRVTISDHFGRHVIE